MKRLISFTVAVMLITLLGVCRSSSYDEYNLTDLAACSSVKSDSNGKGGFVCAFSGNTVFSARLVPDFSAYSFSVGGRIRSVSQSENYTYALVFDDAFTNKYSVYSLNLDNGNVSQNTFVDENFMTSSFSVTDNCIYYIKTDSLKSYVACRDFSDNVNEVFNNNGKSYARLCDGSIYKLSQSSSTYVADTGELKNIYNAGINRVINEDGFIVSLSDNSRNYVSNATAENVSVSDGKIYSAVNYRLNLKTSEKTKSVSIPDRATAIVSYKNQCAVFLDNGTVQVFGSGDFEEKKTSGNDGSNDNHNSSKSDIQPNNSEYLLSDGIVYGIYSGETVADFKNKISAENVYKADGTIAKSGKLKTGFTAVIDSRTYVIAVCGDVTGEGNVNSKDVTLLQKYLCDNAELDGAYLKAADFNLDGEADNRDLVLISRQKN